MRVFFPKRLALPCVRDATTSLCRCRCECALFGNACLCCGFRTAVRQVVSFTVCFVLGFAGGINSFSGRPILTWGQCWRAERTTTQSVLALVLFDRSLCGVCFGACCLV